MTTRYTRDHEWIRLEGDIAVLGISQYAQEQLGDVVFVELPEPGKKLGKGDVAAVVESVKAASEVYTPVAGEVAAVNTALGDTPAIVNAVYHAIGLRFHKIPLTRDRVLNAIERSAVDSQP